MDKILYLASTSQSRQKLLKDSGIEFKIAPQHADETKFDHTLPLEDLVKAIAISKMEHVILSNGKNEEEICYVLTADTLGKNSLGETCTKAKDKDDAVRMLKTYRNGAQTGTAFCIDRKVWRKSDVAAGEDGKNGKWQTDKRIVNFAKAEYIFDVPDNWIERYFELSIKAGVHYLNVSGAVAIEEFGLQFLKTINGSFTAVIGLPLFEIRNALQELSFFD